MKRLVRENKGITLIALIITVIIMLILVGVTVSVAIKGDLFAQAEKAVGLTNAKVQKLQDEANKYIGILDKVEEPGASDSEEARYAMQMARNGEDWISLIQTAEGALSETHSILQRMRELAVQASNGTNELVDREAIASEMKQLVAEITRVSRETNFNDIKLLDGSFGRKIQLDNIILEIDDMSAEALGLGTVTSLENPELNVIIAEDILTAEGAEAYIEVIDMAIVKVSMARANLGSRQNELEHLVSFYYGVAEVLDVYKVSIEPNLKEVALTEIKSILDRCYELSTQGANGTYGEKERADIMTEIVANLHGIEAIVKYEFKGVRVVDGIDLKTLGIERHLSMENVTAEDMEVMITEYRNAIQKVKDELSKI